MSLWNLRKSLTWPWVSQQQSHCHWALELQPSLCLSTSSSEVLQALQVEEEEEEEEEEAQGFTEEFRPQAVAEERALGTAEARIGRGAERRGARPNISSSQSEQRQERTQQCSAEIQPLAAGLLDQPYTGHRKRRGVEWTAAPGGNSRRGKPAAACDCEGRREPRRDRGREGGAGTGLHEGVGDTFGPKPAPARPNLTAGERRVWIEYRDWAAPVQRSIGPPVNYVPPVPK
jgi:hypothetical protein